MQKKIIRFICLQDAHGFCVLSNQAILHYNTSRVYDPNDEGGLIQDDKKIDIISYKINQLFH